MTTQTISTFRIHRLPCPLRFFVLVLLCLPFYGPRSLAQTPETTALDPVRASATDRFLYDSERRVRLFHGLNAVKKCHDEDCVWYPKWLDEQYATQMRNLGLNVVRLGWMWSGFQPSPGENGFSNQYFEVQSGTVDMLGGHGIYTLLDVHQRLPE